MLLLGMAGLLSACSLLPAAKPVQSWTLTPFTSNAASPAPTTEPMSDLRVLRPQTQDLLSGSYLLVVPEGHPVSVYKGARWSASIPNLWRDYLVAALQHDHRFTRISSDEVRVAARYELVSRLDAFQSEYREGKPVVVMRAYLQLVDADSRSILAERALDLSQAAESEEVAAVVEAFSALMAESTAEIQSWLLTAQQAELSRS